MRKRIHLITLALKRCRIYVLTIFLTYWISCIAGIWMSHTGNDFALLTRDKLVGHAMQTDQASIKYQQGNNLSAALIDFGANLFMGAVPQTIMGLGIVIPYCSAAVQGWVGGIVSVDSAHKSRLTGFKSAFYYFFVLLLQFIPYSLAIGAGIKCGVDFYINNKIQGWRIWDFRIQKESLIDLGCVYLLVVPLFFIASCFEFFSTWNI